MQSQTHVHDLHPAHHATRRRRFRAQGASLIAACGTRAPRTLLLDVGGLPIDWIGWQEAVTLVASESVAWTHGSALTVAHGGLRNDGQQSRIEVPAVLARLGSYAGDLMGRTPPLCNPLLFARDRHVCLYCGQRFDSRDLSRDHVHPRCLGGEDTWTNVVTACRRCNHHKGARRPEQAGMTLLAVPYAPNHAEALILANRRIIADQADFLLCHVHATRRARFADRLTGTGEEQDGHHLRGSA